MMFWLRYRKDSNKVIILAYHRILEKRGNFLFDEGVISASPELFEKEIRFCKENFSLINFRQLKECIEKKIVLPPNPLIITFDDGYRDNFTDGFPILRKYNAPATIFLTVDNIDRNKLFWWDEVNFYIKNSGNRDGKNIDTLLHSLKSISNKERIERIERLKEIANIDISKVDVDRQVLNWEEIKEMSQNNIEFGSHTMTHPVLSKIENEKELRYELKESKKIIEHKLGKEVIIFSYPIGGEDSFDSRIKDIVKEMGYSFAVNYIHGINFLNNGFDRFSLNRLDMDQVSLDRFKAKLEFPQLFKR